MKKITFFLAAICIVFLCSVPAIATPVGFEGTYDPSNWTTTKTNSNGYIDTNGVPQYIQVIGSNNGSYGVGNTDFTITSPDDGAVSFNWSYTTADWNANYDPFGYLLNGIFTTLTNPSKTSQSGSSNFVISAGDIFGFRVHSVDNIYGSATAKIFDFDAPAPTPTPEPGTLFLLGSGLLGLGNLTRKKLKQ